MLAAPESIVKVATEIANLHQQGPVENTLPSEHIIQTARDKLYQNLPETGTGLEDTVTHIKEDIAPGFNNASRSARYYGFVTGGTTPASTFADHVVSIYDQNVQVHLSKETVATDIEDRALLMLCELFKLDPSHWRHRTFTTGATASNIIGLACGRDYAIAEAAAARSDPAISVGETGIFEAMHRSGIDKFQILTTVPHSSLSKAASILGMGRASVKLVGLKESPHRFDMPLLKKLLEDPGAASIVAISASEVNTGLFATSGLKEMQEIRNMCDTYGAWIHVDGAFGLMGRILTSSDHTSIISSCEGLELADSITGDAHKLLNVPYDCGFFLSKHREIAFRVFQNPNAAYLSTSADDDAMMSPLNIGIENSRRLRALPVYASLVAYGREGYREMLERQIRLARSIAAFIQESDHFELLPNVEGGNLENIFIIVLFRAKDDALNDSLVDKIKASRKIYVSGTTWKGSPACRFAISNWQADVLKDLPVIRKVLEDVVSSGQ